VSVERSAVPLFAREALGRVSGRELVEWAVERISSGADGEALVKLAGLDLAAEASVFEALPLFHEACGELGLSVPSGREGMLRAYLSWIAEQVVDGRLDPLQAVDTVHRDILGPLEHPPDLRDWCFLWERVDPSRRGHVELTEAEAALRARELAADYAAERGRRTRR
jgi:hypothetical protein